MKFYCELDGRYIYLNRNREDFTISDGTQIVHVSRALLTELSRMINNVQDIIQREEWAIDKDKMACATPLEG